MTAPPRERLADAAMYGFLAIVGIAQFVLVASFVRGDFFNSYPFVSSDGLDWIFQGAVVARKWIEGKWAPDMFILRHPLFVALTASGAWLDRTGLVFAAAGALCTALTGLLFLSIAGTLGISRGARLWGLVCLLVTPLSFWRFWVLSDPLCILLMLAGTLALLKYLQSNDMRMFALANIAMIFAGWTQTYGLIPMMVGTVLVSWHRYRSGRSVALPLALHVVSVSIAVAGLIAWYRLIPHELTPKNFGLLQLSFGMFDFYANLIAIVCAGLIPIAIYFAYFYPLRAAFKDPGFVIVSATAGAFAVLSFFYQWSESRFLFIFYPYLLIFCSRLLDFCSGEEVQHRARLAAVAASMAILVATNFVFVAPDYWRPKLSDLRFDPGGSWLMSILRMPPQDRFGLQTACGSYQTFCSAASDEAGADDYQRIVAKRYRQLRLAPDR